MCILLEMQESSMIPPPDDPVEAHLLLETAISNYRVQYIQKSLANQLVHRDALQCHDRDHTYPYTPYPNLSTPIPSHLNHSRAPNAKPEPSDPLASQQRTPEHSDSLASSQRIPDPMHLRPFLSLASSQFLTPTLIPDPTHPRPLLFLASS